jgi:hypothetical protein
MCHFNRKGDLRAGQSMIETCLAVMMIGVIFAGLVQVSQIFAASEVLQHAALCAARAKTVGFNAWMVKKSMLAAAIPNSGKMLVPDYQNVNGVLENDAKTGRPGSSGAIWDYALRASPSSSQSAIEQARIPSYLASADQGQANAELNYADWDDSSQNKIISVIDGETLGASGGASVIHVNLSQDYPLWTYWHESFYASDTIKLSADSYLENHYPLYIDDKGW